MKKMRFCILIVVLLTIYVKAKSQVDQHFTQYYAYPLFLNPALTGVINDGNIRFVAAHRNQWNNIMMPYKTIGVSFDALLNNNWGMGINVMNQTAGDGGYANNNTYFSICNNNISFGAENSRHFSVGIQAGINSKKFDLSKFRFGDQYNSLLGYDPNINSSATSILKNDRYSNFSVGAGVCYYETYIDKNINYFLGFSINHINKPKDNFTDKASILPLRYIVHAGAKMESTELIHIYPNLVYMIQGNSKEIVPGIQGEIMINDMTFLSVGANYRISSAINALIGLKYNNFNFGFSYDLGVGNITEYITPINSFELTTALILSQKSNPYSRFSKCPSF